MLIWSMMAASTAAIAHPTAGLRLQSAQIATEERQMASINKLAVLVAAIVHFFLGMFWYSPQLFGNQWLAAIGKTSEQSRQRPMLMPIIASFIYYLLMAYVL